MLSLKVKNIIVYDPFLFSSACINTFLIEVCVLGLIVYFSSIQIYIQWFGSIVFVF